MPPTFTHINIVAADWRQLADFYINVFDCQPQLPERDLSGEWVDRLTGLKNARIKGVHLLLPGYETGGPTLEIFEYNHGVSDPHKRINQSGFTHIAFAVENVNDTLQQILAHGGSKVGEVVTAEVAGAGSITVVYAKDPEGNIIELQKWG
ncbi:MAG: VOC family protein [Calditrichia bacterium]|nr:VOC family protein [Calditrichia bacterium]